MNDWDSDSKLYADLFDPNAKAAKENERLREEIAALMREILALKKELAAIKRSRNSFF